MNALLAAGPANASPTSISTLPCTADRLRVRTQQPALASRPRASRVAQQPRQSLGVRLRPLGAKDGRSPSNNASRVGQWLANVGAEYAETAAPAPTRSSRPRASSWDLPPRATSGCVPSRTPLADITARALAVESAPAEPAALPARRAARDARHMQTRHRRRPSLCRGLADDINLLTEDEARRLLLLSAQSNSYLAAAIRELSFGRSSDAWDVNRMQLHARQSCLVDTFDGSVVSRGVRCC
ncbi:uncharacterized protein THITE_2169781 [Thermothielavioides terrestris NRRL 8126]|uniref:Uncharacterized protein n=1 Tax=Thermothielavioides terrestris (strain ATCC 38088 / NRRL 8126) TaxID=578455 RepID=G2QX27_THETT|nr:uncharacterized protein THITE_2169781 [Thermothielavioides terrestris NRRL 8126]AEO64794.1 hypothetical protein THITE_2169781 [Thermothielavioides terrestris NRRL 8126]